MVALFKATVNELQGQTNQLVDALTRLHEDLHAIADLQRIFGILVALLLLLLLIAHVWHRR